MLKNLIKTHSCKRVFTWYTKSISHRTAERGVRAPATAPLPRGMDPLQNTKHRVSHYTRGWLFTDSYPHPPAHQLHVYIMCSTKKKKIEFQILILKKMLGYLN